MPEAIEAENQKVEGVDVVCMRARWDLLQIYHAMGFNKGEMLNLELKIR